MKEHNYTAQIVWTGNQGNGTHDYAAYSRNHEILFPNKTPIFGSADPTFRGDALRYNPEEMLVSAISSCQMLWFLALCAKNGVVVENYIDDANGTMVEDPTNGGRFINVTLRPEIKVQDISMITKAMELVDEAHKNCFIANSCNFPIECEPSVFV